MRFSRHKIFFASLLLLCSLAACGDDDGSGTDEGNDNQENAERNNGNQEESANNGWGEVSFDNFIETCIDYGQACGQDPDADYESTCQDNWDFRLDTAGNVEACVYSDVKLWECMISDDSNCGENSPCMPEVQAVGEYC